jgi:hypothetical protein
MKLTLETRRIGLIESIVSRARDKTITPPQYTPIFIKEKLRENPRGYCFKKCRDPLHQE